MQFEKNVSNSQAMKKNTHPDNYRIVAFKDMSNDDKTHFNQTTPADFIERYASKLGINKELTTVCMFVA